MRDEKERIRDMIEAANRIRRYVRQGRSTFDANELIQVWITHHIEIIGEAARSLSQETKDSIEGIPWNQVIGMRNVLIHGYFGINLDEVWRTASVDVPELRRTLLRHNK